MPEIPETTEEVDFSPRSGSLEALWNSREGSLQALECARGGSSEALECARGGSSQVHECPRGDASQALGACKADSSVLRKRIERRLSVVTVETVDLDCQFIRPDHDDDEDKIIEVEKAETGRVSLFVTSADRLSSNFDWFRTKVRGKVRLISGWILSSLTKPRQCELCARLR